MADQPKSPTADAALVENVARAICRSSRDMDLDDLRPLEIENFLCQARAALAALEVHRWHKLESAEDAHEAGYAAAIADAAALCRGRQEFYQRLQARYPEGSSHATRASERASEVAACVEAVEALRPAPSAGRDEGRARKQ